MITLDAITLSPPAGALALLQELGDGETGFGGTQVATNHQTLTEFLQEAIDHHNGKYLPAGWVAQTTFWILDEERVIGLLRMRHALTAATRISGGHIGYYIRPSERRRGAASHALALALPIIRKLGVTEVMLTTSPSNIGSNVVILSNGGVLRAQVAKEDDGSLVNQYWIGPPSAGGSSGSEATIRPYLGSDATQLCDLFNAAVEGIGPAHYSTEQVKAWLANAPSETDVRKRCADGRITLVATDSSGVVIAYIDLEADGHIDHLYCRPEQSRSGTTRRLYEAIEQIANIRGLPRLYTEASEAALRFFLRQGFQRLHKRELKRSGVDIHNYAMEKTLLSASTTTTE